MGEDGRIWVERYVEAKERPGPPRAEGDQRPRRVWREPRTFDVFEPDGRILGTVVLPEDTYIFVRRGRHVWGTYRDESDVSYIIRLRLETGKR